jgi:hypothetical protein
VYDSFTQSDGSHRPASVIGDPTTGEAAAVVGSSLQVVQKGGTRYSVGIVYEAHATTAADVLMVPTSRSIAGAAEVTTGQYTVTAGRTFRLQAVLASITLLGTTVAATRLRLRLNTAGAVTLTSPRQASWRVGNWSVGTQAASYTQQTESLIVPETLEVPAGGGIGFSVLSSIAAMHTVDLTLLGYEYPA